MNKDDLDSAEKFIKNFIDGDYSTWQANYTVRDEKELGELLDGFTKKFYSFQVTIPIGRPTSPSEEWFETGAKEDLKVTFKRPLFKIDQYVLNEEVIYAAYTGSTDEGSCVYFEILIFKKIGEVYKIFSVYHPDFEGGLTHFQGEKFTFPQNNYVDVRRIQAPDDDLDLQDYNLNPENKTIRS
ncbi:hypothetical protein [Deinococcus altitudinis]|uniref:hypothetical protein n=1 Tax=Deinococcus altitudinis TaxID=468914 RepID=UPI0038927866